MHIPFLQTHLPCAEEYSSYLLEIDQNHWHSNFGPLVKQFEQEVLEGYFSGQGEVCTVANCTLGLILALKAVSRRQGKYVIMPSFTFAATALAAKWAGLEPYFVDINSDDWSVNVQEIEEAISIIGDDIAAVMPYAAYGTAIDLAYFHELENRGIPVVIDAAPCLGVSNPDSTPFTAGFPGVVVFSLHATKPFGIGEGGLIYSGSQEIIRTIRQLSNFGFSSPGIADMAGLNAKLPEISAAVGLAVIKTFRQKHARLETLFQAYLSAIADSELLDKTANTQLIRGNIPHQFMPIILPAYCDVGWLVDELDRLGIETRRYFYPSCHQQKVLADVPHGPLQTTEDICERVLCLPLWDGMQADVPQLVIEQLTILMQRFVSSGSQTRDESA